MHVLPYYSLFYCILYGTILAKKNNNSSATTNTDLKNVRQRKRTIVGKTLFCLDKLFGKWEKRNEEEKESKSNIYIINVVYVWVRTEFPCIFFSSRHAKLDWLGG